MFNMWTTIIGYNVLTTIGILARREFNIGATTVHRIGYLASL